MEKGRLPRFAVLAILLVSGVKPFPPIASAYPSPSFRIPMAQDFPDQKPKYDYMSTFLSRSTKPLGLKEDLIMKKLLKQPRASWATRAGLRHILD